MNTKALALPTPPVPDLARATGNTVDELFSWFIAYYDRPDIPWNYVPGTRCIKAAYTGYDRLPQIIAGCASVKNEQGRKSNEEIVQLAAPLAFGRSIRVFSMPRRQFAFGRDRRAGYRVPFFFVENGIVKLYYLQPRKGAALTIDQLGMVATIHQNYLLKTEFFGQVCDVEYVDLSKDTKTGERKCSTYTLATLPLWSEERLADRLTMIAEALDRVAASGLVVPRRRRAPATSDMPLFD